MKNRSISPLLPAALIALAGCSGGDPSAEPAKAVVAAGAKSDDPVAAAAYDFMDAVFANDIARATQRLTPAAIQNLQAQDKRFEWGAAAAKLEIGQVRVENDEAAVECRVTDNTNGSAQTDQLLCVLRRVSGEWRVYGVAWEGADGGEPQVVNFEELPAESAAPETRPTSGDRYVESAAPQIPAQPETRPVRQESVAELPSGLLQ